jgi:hypothetical protein
MPTFRITSGVLTLADQGLNYPDNELPSGGGGQIDNSLPIPPPPLGVWPPPVPAHPIVPAPPGTPPGVIWPSPGRPVDPGYGRPVAPPHPGGGPMPGNPPRPDAGLPGGQGGQIDNALPSQTFWMLAYCPSQGWMYISVDPSLRPGHDLPPHPEPK